MIGYVPTAWAASDYNDDTSYTSSNKNYDPTDNTFLTYTVASESATDENYEITYKVRIVRDHTVKSMVSSFNSELERFKQYIQNKNNQANAQKVPPISLQNRSRATKPQNAVSGRQQPSHVPLRWLQRKHS